MLLGDGKSIGNLRFSLLFGLKKDDHELIVI